MADENPQQASGLAQAPQSPTDTQSDMSLSSNCKRKAEGEPEGTEEQGKKMRQSDDEAQKETTAPPIADIPAEGMSADAGDAETAPLTKNQLKRLRKQAAYGDFKERRKEKRKEKRHQKQAKKRTEKENKIAEAVAAGLDPSTVLQPPPKPEVQIPIPVNIVLDCDFEQYMREGEIVSLSSQVVRAYSDVRKSRYQPRLWITSFGGKMGERFETTLKNTHKNWRGVEIRTEDFKKAAEGVKGEGPTGWSGEVIDAIKPSEDGKRSLRLDPDAETAPAKGEPEPELGDDVDQSVVYLTSESPYTLERLEANTTYVIGGIVDKNREKGLCYRRAKDYKVRTARLPIGEYMAMQSRYVLTTNQVVEIMVKWFECGDWGEAFLTVIPKRKGGVLKNGDAATLTQDAEARGDDEGENEEESKVVETEGEKNDTVDAAQDADGDEKMTEAQDSKTSVSVP